MVHGRVNFPAFSGATAPKRVICSTVIHIHTHTDMGIMLNTIIRSDISIITIVVITDDPSTQTMPGIGQRRSSDECAYISNRFRIFRLDM